MLTNVLKGIFAVVSALVNGFSLLLKCDSWPSPLTILMIFIIFAIWFGSGFFAATVAEMTGNPMRRHFLIGLLLPYFYPVYLMKHLKFVAAAAEAHREELVDLEKVAAARRFDDMRLRRMAEKKGISLEEAQAQEEAARADAAAEAAAQEAATAQTSEFCAAYFEQLPVSEDGLRPGPFRITRKDGGVLNVDAIKQIQPELLVLSAGGKTLRVRFEMIAAFER